MAKTLGTDLLIWVPHLNQQYDQAMCAAPQDGARDGASQWF